MSRCWSKILRFSLLATLLFPGLRLSAHCGMPHCSMGPRAKLRCAIDGLEARDEMLSQAAGHAVLYSSCGACGNFVVRHSTQAVNVRSTLIRWATAAYPSVRVTETATSYPHWPGSRLLSRAGPVSPGTCQALPAVPCQHAPPPLV